MPFAGVVIRDPLDGLFRISEPPESATIGLHGHHGVPLNMCAVVFRITDIVASQMRDIIQTLHVRISLVRLETHHLVAEFAQVSQMASGHPREYRIAVSAPIRVAQGMSWLYVRIRG